MKAKVKKMLLIIAVILGLIIFANIGNIGYFIEPKLPDSQNTYGEFPFRIVYELDGERITIEDVLICEYGGNDWNEGMGRYIWSDPNPWSTFFVSSSHILQLALLHRLRV
jgi:hypothetical protein